MSAYSFTATTSLLKKEFLEHKTPFLYVPGIFVILIFGSFFVSAWSHGSDWQLAGLIVPKNDGIDIFNAFYSVSIVVWLGYLTLMLFVFFASSFSADRKDNALLFWKSIPVSDLEILGTKTLAGMLVFPLVIMGWALITAVFGYIILSAVSASSPLVAALNSGTSLWTLVNVQVSALVFVAGSLLWYLPIFAFVGLLGTLLRGWAVPAFILILVMVGVIESIINFAQGGQVSEWIAYRFEAPFQSANAMMEDLVDVASVQVIDIMSVANFVPTYLVHINWTEMVVGWLFAGVFVYLASEYRRRRLAV